ncbi:transporter substrate-binding domain-containing protein [Vibrio sp. Isolate23]|uniref:substrate-binding periplasmic protein n=1 Tax=Vibrio sp. Isolate23 TaxID=2908533 RepID=UPI001EFDEE1A|nr:transporter substrate-binding domain-containing protein [Vibrio sp. Isolate23]MCG9682886.1 transporter substrate-binding domain-containing protein [Vibrio sp. Isolate23]
MNHFTRRLCLFLAAASMSLSVWASTTLRLAYSDVESYPFQMGNGASVANPPGLALDVINHVALQLDLNIEYVRLPGKRVLQDIGAAKVDGGFIFSFNTQRAQYASYPMSDNKPDASKRIATIGYYFYTLQNHTLEWDGQSLADTDQKVGAHLGFSIVRELKKKQLKVHEVKTTEQLFTMLQLERLSAIAVQDTMAQQFLSSQKMNNIKQIEPAITTKNYYLVLSHQFVEKNPELAEKIWEAIETSRDEVFLKQKDKYID